MVVLLILALFLSGCDAQGLSAEGTALTETKSDEPVGSIERLDTRLDKLIPKDARLEKLVV